MTDKERITTMRFTADELIFLNSIIDGKSIFGLHISAPEMEAEEFVEKTQQTLRNKNILDKKNHITKLGFIPVYALEMFKKSSKKIIFNRMRISINDDGSLTLISRDTDGNFEMQRQNKYQFLQLLLKQYPFLCRAKETRLAEEIHTDADKIAKMLKEIPGENLIIFKKYISQKCVHDRLYCWDNLEGWAYNPLDNKLRVIGGRELRLILVREMEIKLDVEVRH